MNKLLLLLFLTLCSCISSNQDTKSTDLSSNEDFELLNTEVYTPQTIAVSVYTPSTIDTKKAGEIFRQFEKPYATVTIFFYKDKTKVTDTNYYAYTDGSFLYFKGEKTGEKIE